MKHDKPHLSIVTTMYKSASYLEPFHARMTKAAINITSHYEIIFVDDGSPDDSLAVALTLAKTDERIKVIQLSRNFGHHKAMLTGLQHAQGDYVFLIDCDLEEDPELLLQFWDKLNQDKNIDVVYGVQNQRKGNWMERWSGDVYFRLLSSLSNEINIVRNISTIRLMKQAYVNQLTQFQESNYYFGPISTLVGFNQIPFQFNKRSKKISSYNFLKKYHIFLDSIIAFSSKPLYFIFYLGTILTLFSFGYMIYLIIRNLIWGITIKGWTSIIVLISLFGGINMFFLGIISIYILHIFKETKNRPFSIIKHIHHNAAASPKASSDHPLFNILSENN